MLPTNTFTGTPVGTGASVPLAQKLAPLKITYTPRRENRLRRAPVRSFAASPTSAPRPSTVPGLIPLPKENDVPIQMPKQVEGPADDPNLHNPLQRHERLGTNWMGVIFELEGVAVDLEYGDIGQRVWMQLAQEEGKSPPPRWALKRAEGMKNEQIIQEVFCWTRNPVEVRRLAARKEAILQEQLGDRKPLVQPGTLQLLDTLQRTGVPVALVSSAPERRVLATLQEAGLMARFDVIVTADDVHRGKPDPEGYLYAAQQIGRPPLRCVVVGSSNLSIEAAHEVGMQIVTVAGRHPVYELTAADLVVRSLGDLSFVNLKQLFSLEESVSPLNEDGEQMEMEVDRGNGGVVTTVMEYDSEDDDDNGFTIGGGGGRSSGGYY